MVLIHSSLAHTHTHILTYTLILSFRPVPGAYLGGEYGGLNPLHLWKSGGCDFQYSYMHLLTCCPPPGPQEKLLYGILLYVLYLYNVYILRTQLHHYMHTITQRQTHKNDLTSRLTQTLSFNCNYLICAINRCKIIMNINWVIFHGQRSGPFFAST